MHEEDTGGVKMVKMSDRANTLILPLTVTFALNIIVGVNYSFSFVLYFLVIIPVFLFNIFEIHKKYLEHKVFICFADNLWILISFFWLLNIWTTGKYQQPYFIQ